MFEKRENCILCSESLLDEDLSVIVSPVFGKVHSVCMYSKWQRDKLCPVCHRALEGESHNGLMCHSFADADAYKIHSSASARITNIELPKYEPYCDCGVCNFCDGSEDKFGNRRAPSNSMPYAPGQKARDEYFAKQNTSEVALKIRFVLLENAIVTEFLSDDKIALGFTKEFSVPDALNMRQLRWWSYLDRLLDTMFDSNARVRTDFFPNAEYRDKDFECYKQALTEFAENNGFFGNEKPATRIEFENDDLLSIFRMGERVDILTVDSLFAVNELGVVLPIYKPAPKFTHEWRKISPPEFTFEQIGAATILLEGERHGVEYALEEINRRLTDLPEIWEFTLIETPDA